jgi:hypothetical protein
MLLRVNACATFTHIVAVHVDAEQLSSLFLSSYLVTYISPPFPLSLFSLSIFLSRYIYLSFISSVSVLFLSSYLVTYIPLSFPLSLFSLSFYLYFSHSVSILSVFISCSISLLVTLSLFSHCLSFYFSFCLPISLFALPFYISLSHSLLSLSVFKSICLSSFYLFLFSLSLSFFVSFSPFGRLLFFTM